MKRVIIVAGGPNPATKKIKKEQYDFWIGVDRGAITLIHNGFPIDVAFGDFDSVLTREYLTIKKRAGQLFEYNSEKDDTDLQLALMYVIEQLPEVASIHIFGGLGSSLHGRIDHFIANMWISYEPRFASIINRIRWIEEKHEMQAFLPGKHCITNELEYRYLSIISYTPVKQLAIEGAKYQLAATDFDVPRALISNEFLPEQPEVLLSFETGIVTVWFVKKDNPVEIECDLFDRGLHNFL
ncbi:thiamine diphosphokinase [Tuanshanicoccus lijuaniae]|uniref:thiamine diphosphokinase n=1 Tax=Aerococcaceae bacterium zg-1292 TaxID=2774330 RepID=UPI00193738D6|nr:thiamine diphosphokinase [Aerococcaceae bacterium zg-1292]QQA37423.1 thiamine diphosphokinase [Aerococcaceae bacterium zg-1292]